MISWRRRAAGAVSFLAVLSASGCSAGGGPVLGLRSAAGTYQADDGAKGRAMDILPAGENGLVNQQQLSAFGSSGARPPNSVDQLLPYNDLIYGSSSLTNANLKDYYLDESFGVRPKDVSRIERPDRSVKVVIYRDRNGIPHIYGASLDAMAYGAGYAGAEDRLFLMDVLRHYGQGDLMSFLGPSCDYESMDYQEIMSKGYTRADLRAQLRAMPRRFGKLGSEVVSMVRSYVAGVNRYIESALRNQSMMPVEYAALGIEPHPWRPTDVVAVSTLIALEATGGGDEVQNAALYEYLRNRFGTTAAASIFADMKEQNDPSAPTVIENRFPYMIPTSVDSSLTALPDSASFGPLALTGAPMEFTAGCTGGSVGQEFGGTSSPALAQQLAEDGVASHSNAVVISASRSADGHPIAVFGPELGYYDPEILMQEDLHAPGYEAAGAAFPGANFVVELGRGSDYAWSATTASTDQVDMRVEKLCSTDGGAPPTEGTYYLFRGRCLAMTSHSFTESVATTSVTRLVHYSVHGVVQGWSTVDGRPVAIARQDANRGHDLDQLAGYLAFGMPSVSNTPSGWMHAAADISYSFNWFYLNSKDIAYYVSGRDPIRDPHADPNLPTWGTGVAEWKGFLGFGSHPHSVNPPRGYLVSWNNKPAPGFSASDDLYAWGPVFRSQLLTAGLVKVLSRHSGRLNRAELAALVENAATQDLDAYSLVNPVLDLIGPALDSKTPTGIDEMVGQLQQWAAAGYHRRKADPSATQYSNPAAVAIWDELYPYLVEGFFDRVFSPGGVESYMGLPDGYKAVPMLFSETPDDTGQHDGDGFYSGWEGYLLKAIDQAEGKPLFQPLSPALTSMLCGSGLTVASCRAATLSAFERAYTELVAANGGSTDVTAWTQDTNTATLAARTGKPQTLPLYDDIQFQQAGAIPLPAMDWENRPTYQQVVEFPG